MADAPDEIVLTVAGRAHRGWTRAEVQTGIDSAADQFTLELTERYPGQPERQVIAAGAEATIAVGGEPLIGGYIDRITVSLSGEDRILTITGRSKAADLIDCSAVATPGSWRNRSLEAIAAEIAQPFGISVTAKASTAPVFKAFAIEPGETAYAAIERMCKLRGLLPISDAQGNLTITRPEPLGDPIELKQGVDILAIDASHDVSERFSEYRIKGQARGDDDANGRAVAHAKGSASDPGVTRMRPLLVVADGNIDSAAAKRRAEWEASVRAARAQSIVVTRAGWRESGDGRSGALWAKARRVRIDAEAVFVQGEMLVANVAFMIANETGRTVALTCANPKAYAPEPVPEEAKASRIGGAA
jgi:prophage tail gpP-like protein